MQKTLFSLAALALLAGCSLAPVLPAPQAGTVTDWPQGAPYQALPAAAADAQPAAEILWRDYFSDASLREVIALALANNRDLRVSALNIDKAKAQYNIDSAALLPKLSANLGQTASRTPAALNGSAAAQTSHQYSAGLTMAAYELDFFGKLRNLSEAGLHSYLATEEARRAQQITLVAEVAHAYLTLGADQQRLQLATETLRSQQISLKLNQQRFERGVTAGVDLYDAQSSVEAARSDLALYTAQVALDTNALRLLVGADIPAALLPAAALDVSTSQAAIPAGLPAELLQRRPDVQQAERALRAANANIGVARAAFFPSVTLTASGGSASNSLNGLFKAGSSNWSFIPQINLPIFDGGVNRANLNIARADRDISLAQYEKAIQSAFREVADALAQRGTLVQRLDAQQALVAAADKSYRVHEARYRQGAESYLAALVAQRALYAAQQGLIGAQLEQSANAVTLYKVLGGGWQPESLSPRG